MIKKLSFIRKERNNQGVFKMNKILNILLIGLFIIAVVGLIYLAIPKYQVNTVRINDNQILITKINTLTGLTSLETRNIKFSRFSD